MSINDFKKKLKPDQLANWLAEYLDDHGQCLSEAQRQALEGEGMSLNSMSRCGFMETTTSCKGRTRPA